MRRLIGELPGYALGETPHKREYPPDFAKSGAEKKRPPPLAKDLAPPRTRQACETQQHQNSGSRLRDRIRSSQNHREVRRDELDIIDERRKRRPYIVKTHKDH